MFGWIRRIIQDRKEQKEAIRIAEQLAREKLLKDAEEAREKARHAAFIASLRLAYPINASPETTAAWKRARERATVYAPQPANRYQPRDDDRPISDALAWSMISSSLSSPSSSGCSPGSSDSSSSSPSSSSCSSSSDSSSSGGDSGGSCGGGSD